jgi:hypothetical protein
VAGTGYDRAVTLLMAAASSSVPPGAVGTLVGQVAELLGARSARLYVSDYSMRRLQQVDDSGAIGAPVTIAGSHAGRAFLSSEPTISARSPIVVSVPLVEGTDRIGLLELDVDDWDGTLRDVLDPLVVALVLILVTRGRYSDQWVRARRSEALSAAAEIQWDLLPPLSCSTVEAAVGGILEPAYAIGGDSFDYAFNAATLDFAIVDAIGHGLPAVLMSAAAINGLRHARRSGLDLIATYRQVDALIESAFGNSNYVTAQVGSLELATGVLTWVNAGHVLPMLVRNGTYAGELACTPSRPLGLGGDVVEVRRDPLQCGDRVLFYTDGMIESRSPDGATFGQERLADFLVRASLERVPAAETARRLSASVVEYVGVGLNDDATLLLIDYAGPPRTTQPHCG